MRQQKINKESELKQRRKEIEELKNEYDDKIAMLTEENKKFKSFQNELTEKLNESKENEQAIMDKYNHIIEEQKDLNTKYDELLSENIKSQKQYDAKYKVLETHYNELQSKYNTSKDENKSSKESNERNVKELESENVSKQQMIESLGNELNSVNNGIIEKQKESKSKYEALMNEKDELIKQHQNNTDVANKEYKELKDRYDEILEGSKKDKVILVELKSNMDLLKTKNDEYQQQIKALDIENTNLSDNISEITTELKQQQSSNAKYEETVTDLQTKCDELRSENTKLHQKHDELNKELLNKYNEINKNKNEIGEKLGNISSILLEMKQLSKVKEIEEIYNKMRNIADEVPNEIKNGVREIIDNHRKLMGLDISQNMRYLKDSIEHKNDNNENIEKLIDDKLPNIENALAKIQQNLSVKAKIDADAIETAQETITNGQLVSDASNQTEFSSLGSSIHKMKSQINHIMDSMDSIKLNQESTYLKKELPHLIANTLKSSFIQHNLQKEQKEQENIDGDDDIESIKSEQSSTSQKHLRLKEEIDDEMEETLQSNFLQIVNQSKDEIIQHIDNKLIHEIQINNNQNEEEKQYSSTTDELSLLQPEIDKISSKLDTLSLSLNDNNTKMDSFVTCTQFNNAINEIMEKEKPTNDSQQIISEIKSIQKEIDSVHVAIANHSNALKEVNKNNEIDDEMKETLQSNFLQIVNKSKDEIIQHIDNILIHEKKEEHLPPRSKQKKLLEDDYKEQQEYENELESTRQFVEHRQLRNNDSSSRTNELLLLQPEIDKISSKLESLSLSLNNNNNKMDSFVTCTQFNNAINGIMEKEKPNDSQPIISEIKSVQKEINSVHAAIDNHSNILKEINKKNEIQINDNQNEEEKQYNDNNKKNEFDMIKFGEIWQQNIDKNRDIDKTFYAEQMEQCQKNLTLKLDDLQKRITLDLNKNKSLIRQESSEMQLLPNTMDLEQIEIIIKNVHKAIKSIKPSTLTTAASNLMTALFAQLIVIIAYFTYIGIFLE